MPGLYQLEKFREKITSLGNEPQVRAESGEPRPEILLPANISDADDSDDFMFGLSNIGAPPPEESGDDFLSGLDLNTGSDGQSADDDFFSKLPDVSSDTAADDIAADLPDAMQESDLDSLFGSIQPPEQFTAKNPEKTDVDSENFSEFTDNTAEPQTAANVPQESSAAADLNLDDLNLNDLNLNDLPDFGSSDDLSAPLDSNPASQPLDLPEDGAEESAAGDFDQSADFNLLKELDLPDGMLLPESGAQTSAEQIGVPADFDMPADFDLLKDLDLPDGLDTPQEPLIEASDDLPRERPGEIDADLSDLLGNVDDLFDGNLPDAAESQPDSVFGGDLSKETADIISETAPSEDFSESLPDFADSLPDFAETGSPLDAVSPDFDPAADNLPDFDFPSADTLPNMDDLQPENALNAGEFASADSDSGLGDLGDLGNLDFGPSTDFGGSFGIPADALDASGESHPADDMFSGLPGEFDLPSVGEPTGNEKNVAPDSEHFEFDTNFFPAADGASSRTPTIPKPEEKLPNEFTDEEYRRFLTNLHVYPLNLRVAIQELIVENQFTDDVVADLVRRVIKKTGARQLASHIGKLLDKTIPIPRDFEKRTATQYDLYKQSVEYQIKNRVLPAVFLTFAAVALGALLLFFGNKFVYRPIRAEILYNQGYKLLESNAYPQSEQKFNEAVIYNSVKSWFLKFASGYTTHKQYERARQIYDRGLIIFNNDKKIGLEYATMELKELANYERATEIIKRHILDYYINDKDGLLLLGDVYLDWATEKDRAKFEEARKQYAALIELYGETDLYLSRMMRYFIRTDNLRQVLPLKEYFFPKKKALPAQDLVELSGYLLEKQYGPLSPADEYLRAYIEDVRTLLERAQQADRKNPETYYNFGKYFIHTGNRAAAKSQFSSALSTFTALSQPRTRVLIAKNIDTYRLLGNLYAAEEEYLMAEELYALGIQMFEKERDVSSLSEDSLYGKLYADMGDLNYFISGDLERAYSDYQNSIKLLNDTPAIRYKVGYIQYNRKNYPEALGSFIKTASEIPADRNLLYALGTVLSLRNDNFAAQAYYELLMTELDREKQRMGVLFPQVNADQGDLVTLYMYAANNLGVTLHRLSQQTGDSAKNARAMVCFADSVRAWDALTRNQTTMTRLDGTNLAAQNLKYATFPMPDYQPEIYPDIYRTLYAEPELSQTALKK